MTHFRGFEASGAAKLKILLISVPSTILKKHWEKQTCSNTKLHNIVDVRM